LAICNLPDAKSYDWINKLIVVKEGSYVENRKLRHETGFHACGIKEFNPNSDDLLQLEEQIKGTLFAECSGKEQQKKKINFKIINCRLDLEPGSAQSRKFHQKLEDLEHSDVMHTETLTRILQYKWKRVEFIGHSLICFYLLYLIMIHVFPRWECILPWSIIHIAHEVYQLLQSPDASYSTYFRSVWNYLATTFSWILRIRQ
jgi:hypothetical protein